jgi:hypothetical protein
MIAIQPSIHNPLTFHSRQATLLTSSHTCECRFIPLHIVAAGCGTTWKGLRGCRVIAHMPLWIALQPLLPVRTQGWAPQAKTRNFIDVPFSGFLGPLSRMENRLEYCTTHLNNYTMIAQVRQLAGLCQYSHKFSDLNCFSSRYNLPDL